MSERDRCGSVRRTPIARGPPSGTSRGSSTVTPALAGAEASTISSGSVSRLLTLECYDDCLTRVVVVMSIPAGSTAVVTGASRGIGRAIALALAAEGVDIVGVSSNRGSADYVGPEVEALGVTYRGLATNLAERDELYGLIDEVRSSVGTPQILVHAAGIARRAPAGSHSDEFWDEVIAVNLTAPFILTRELGASMVERGSGKVVFIASLLSFQGGLTVPSYAASKGGVAQLVKSFSNEWASKGVNVNAIAPGYVETDLNEALLADETRHRQISERIPAGRWAQATDIAGAAVFLASSAADYVHGTVLPVDGGWLGR